jgi:hypothetical protein
MEIRQRVTGCRRRTFEAKVKLATPVSLPMIYMHVNHSNRKKHYQLVEPHYQGLGSGFGSCLAVKHERNGNNHFGTATTNMVVNYQIPNQLLTTTVW